MDVYIYQADIYCDACGEAIKERILSERSLEKCPECKYYLCHLTINGEDVFGCPICKKEISREESLKDFDIDDESAFDSDEFPKGPYPDGGGESDSPQHCASGGGCLNGIDLEPDPSNGEVIRVGCWLENDLTTQGVDYVNEYIRESRARGEINEVTRLWHEWYCRDYELEPLEEEE